MIQAVIFDLDGVLVATDQLHYEAWKQLACALGIADFTLKDNLRQRGVSRMESLEVLLRKSKTKYTPAEKQKFAEQKNRYYTAKLQELDESALLPGALETLAELRRRGVKTAVASASRNAGLILERTGLQGRFDALVDGFEAERSKPDPQVFQLAAQKLGTDPGRCLAVEDADAGVQAASAAGMAVLGVGPAALNRRVRWHARDLADTTLAWEQLLKTEGPQIGEIRGRLE